MGFQEPCRDGSTRRNDGTIMIGSTPGQLRQHMANESVRWRGRIADSGIGLAD